MRVIYWKNIAVLLVLCFLIFTLSIVSASTQADAASSIESAKTQLANAFQLTVDAERAGANVTELTATLNDAGSLLSQAEYAYSKGDFNTSQNLSIQSQAKLDGFTAHANILMESANQQRTENFWTTIVYPILGALAVVTVGVAVWLSLKKKYGSSGAK